MSQLLELFEDRLPRLVMFDLDGTLVDSVPDIAWSMDQMLIELELDPVGLEKVRQWVGNGAVKLIQRSLDFHGVDSSEESCQQALTVFKRYYQDHLAEASVLYEGVEHCLAYLQEEGCTLACITNKPIEFANPMLEALDVAPYFELVVGGECLPARKPDPMPLQYAMDTFACSPDETLMIGDSRSDILGAQNAGCRSVCVSYGYNQGENMCLYAPDLMVDSLAELI